MKKVTNKGVQVYEGMYENHKKAGFGRLTSINGNKYIGQYVDGKKEGYGVSYFQNGAVHMKHSKDDKNEGICLKIRPNNQSMLYCTYRNDRVIEEFDIDEVEEKLKELAQEK